MSDQYDGPAMARQIIRLQAENEKLRADAERYRWLRNAREKDWLRLSDMTAEDTEAAIDAARGSV